MAIRLVVLILAAAFAAAAGCSPGRKPAAKKNRTDPAAVAAVRRIQADMCNINSQPMWNRVDQSAEFNIRSEFVLYPEKFRGQSLEQALAQTRETMKKVRAEHPAPAYSVCEFDPPGFADCDVAFRGDVETVAPEFRAQSDEDLKKIQSVLKDMGITQCAVFTGRTREKDTDVTYEADVIAGLRHGQWVLLSFTAAGSPVLPETPSQGDVISQPAPALSGD